MTLEDGRIMTWRLPAFSALLMALSASLRTEVLTILTVLAGDSRWRRATEVSTRRLWLASRCQSVESALRLQHEGSSALVAEEKQCHLHPCGRRRLHPRALKGTRVGKDIPRLVQVVSGRGETVGEEKFEFDGAIWCGGLCPSLR